MRILSNIKNTTFIAYVKLFTVILTWGSVYHFAKILVTDTDIYTVAFVRFFIASIILLLLYYKKNKTIKFIQSKQEYTLLLLIGFFGIFLYNLLFFKAESLIPANDVAILYSLTPCITVILGVFIFKNKLNIFSYIGLIIALFGAILTLTLSNAECHDKLTCTHITDLSFGAFIAITASFSMAVYSILNKKASYLKIDTLSITTISTIIGTILLFITFLLYGAPPSNLLHKDFNFWFAMFYVAVFSTVLGYSWYIDSIRDLGVAKTVVFLNGVPLSSIIIGAIAFNQFISIAVLFSGLIIITGVTITNINKSS